MKPIVFLPMRTVGIARRLSYPTTCRSGCPHGLPVTLRGVLERVLPHAHVELRARQPQTMGGLRLVPMAVAKDLCDRVALDGVQVGRRRDRRTQRALKSKMLRADQAAFAENRRALEGIAQ